jgi:hypothetical protein
MSTPESNKPDRWRRWLWVTPAILIISGIVNVMNPHLDPGLRVVWMCVLLPLAVILFGYFLYAHYRGFCRKFRF